MSGLNPNLYKIQIKIMPFKGWDTQNKKLIFSFDYTSKFELRANHPEIICPSCRQAMYARERNAYRLHFVHNNKTENCALSRFESWKHLEGKKIVYDILKEQVDNLSEKFKTVYSVDIEHRVQEINRIIDVALIQNGQAVEAHEIQISPISIPELEARTQDYSSRGIATYWYFEQGGSLTSEVQNWLIKNFGEVRYFTIQTTVVNQ